MKRAQHLRVGKGVALLTLASALIAPVTALADDPYGLGPGSSAPLLPREDRDLHLSRSQRERGGEPVRSAAQRADGPAPHAADVVEAAAGTKGSYGDGQERRSCVRAPRR